MALADLMAKLGVSDDTMRRDLRDIEAAGHNISSPTTTTNDRRTPVRLMSRSYIDVPLTRSEAHMFAGTRRLWAPFRGTSLHDDMENLFIKRGRGLLSRRLRRGARRRGATGT